MVCATATMGEQLSRCKHVGGEDEETEMLFVRETRLRTVHRAEDGNWPAPLNPTFACTSLQHLP
jgi:hypothetical protein